MTNSSIKGVCSILQKASKLLLISVVGVPLTRVIFRGNKSFGLEDEKEREERKMESKQIIPVRVYSDGLNVAMKKV